MVWEGRRGRGLDLAVWEGRRERGLGLGQWGGRSLGLRVVLAVLDRSLVLLVVWDGRRS